MLFKRKWFKWKEGEKIEIELRSKRERQDTKDGREEKRESKEED